MMNVQFEKCGQNGVIEKDNNKDESIKSWVADVINEFVEYYDIQFKHFIITEELL